MRVRCILVSRSVVTFLPTARDPPPDLSQIVTNSGGQYISADEFRCHRLVNPDLAFGPAEIDTYTYSDGASSSLVGFRGRASSVATVMNNDAGRRAGSRGEAWSKKGLLTSK